MPEISQEELLRLLDTEKMPERRIRIEIDGKFWYGLIWGLFIAAFYIAFIFIAFALF